MVLVWVPLEYAVEIFDGLIELEDLLSNLLMLAGSFSFLLLGPLLRVAYNMASDLFSRENYLIKRMSNKDNVIYHLISKVTCHHFHHILLVTQTNSSSLWEGAY